MDKLIYNNTIEDWGTSILIILGALLLNKLIVVIYRKVIKKITAKSHTHSDDILIDALVKPVLMGILLLSFWIAINRLELAKDIKDLVSKSYDILVVLNITWFFARLATALIEEFSLTDMPDKT